MKRYVLPLILILACIIISGSANPTGDPIVQPLGSYYSGYIINELSGLCLEPVPSDGSYNGTYLQIGECQGYAEQHWELTDTNQLYNPAYDKCLDTVGDPGLANGSKLQMYDCQEISENPNQIWRYVTNGYIRHQRSERCIDVPGAKGTKPGSILQIWDCELNNSSTDQRWRFESAPDTSFGGNNAGFSQTGNTDSSSSNSTSQNSTTAQSYGNIVNLLTNKCIDPVGYGTSNGTKVQIADCNSDSDKYWELTADGFLRNPTSGKCLDVAGAPGSKDGTPLQLWDCETSSTKTDQKWTITNNYLQNLYSGKCVDAPGQFNTTSGTLLQLWECEFLDAANTDQRWVFEPPVTASNPYVGGVSNQQSTSHCNDTDQDCISDSDEQSIISAFMPIFVFDEQEHNILIDQNPKNFSQGNGVEYLNQLSPVDCSTEYDYSSQTTLPIYEVDPFPFGPKNEYPLPKSLLFTIMEIFPYDYLPKQNYLWDANTEEDVFAHYGDIETIQLCLRDDDRDSNYEVSYVHFRRHKHAYTVSPKGMEKEGTHLVIYVSEGKHGTYTSEDECHDAVADIQRAYWAEDCGGGKVINPKVDSIHNVGEWQEGKYLYFSDLGLTGQFEQTADYAGFSPVDEVIWKPEPDGPSDREMYFCGGMDVDGYIRKREITFFYSDNTCPGGLTTRWWQHPSSCWEEQTDRVGSDYKVIKDLIVDNPRLCELACMDDLNCVAFTHVHSINGNPPICNLKNAVPPPTSNMYTTSGIRNNCD